MKLKELNQQARCAGFDSRRITRVHSSLYRLASGIPERSEPTYFSSKWACLYAALYGLDDAFVVSNTDQYVFNGRKKFNVYQF